MSRILLLSIIVIFILLYITLQSWHIPTIFWFITAGLTLGMYYGWFNHDIFHKSAKFSNEFDKVHVLWIHIVCSFISSFCLFVLYKKFILSSSEFGLGDFALLIFGTLGIVGLLPRTFWFLANKGEIKI